jgi:hypothetical protein
MDDKSRGDSGAAGTAASAAIDDEGKVYLASGWDVAVEARLAEDDSSTEDKAETLEGKDGTGGQRSSQYSGECIPTLFQCIPSI